MTEQAINHKGGIKMKYADFLAFLAPEGKPPVADPELTPELLSLAHLTSAPPWAKTMDEVLKYHREYRRVIESQPKIKVVEIAKDLLADDKIKVVLGLQNPPENTNLGKLYKEGIRITTIAYEGRNSYGSGFADPSGGLTRKGELFVLRCSTAGLILDLSHANSTTIMDITSFMDRNGLQLPLVATHSGSQEVYHHSRNLSFTGICSIAGRGGIIGVPTLTFILDPKENGLGPFFDHLYRILSICGEDSVVIGGDGPYCTQDLSEWERHIGELSKKLDTLGKFKPRFPHHPFVLNTPRRMEVLENEMKKRRWLPSSVREKILSKNLFRFLERNLPQE